MKNNIKRILIVTLNNTGDVVLTTGAIEAVLRQYPEARTDIVVGPNGKEVFEKNGKISKTFIYDKHAGLFEKFRLIKKLRNMHYDLVIDLKNTLIPFLVGAKIATKPIRKVIKEMHKKDEHLFVARSVGIDTTNINLNIELNKNDFKKRDAVLSKIGNKKFIVISCGAKSHTKRWPAPYFAHLADRIKKELDYEVVFIGKTMDNSPDSDRIVTNEVKKNMISQAIDLVGRTNLREMVALIKGSSLLVTNDSAPLHVASAVNTPTLAIFGPTDEIKYGPLADHSIVLRKKIECSPCEMPQCKFDYECMKQITQDEAFQAVKKILYSLTQSERK